MRKKRTAMKPPDNDEILERLKALAANVHFLTEKVNNIELRCIDIEIIVKACCGQQIEDFELFQFIGGKFMAINGVAVGATGTFQIGFVPPNGVPLPAPPTVSVDDPMVTFSPVSTDGQFTFTAAVAAGDTGASFNVTVSGTNAAGVALSHVFNVPIIAAPPPQITDFTLNQLS